MPTVEERVQRLEDLAAIQRLLKELVRACDEPYDADRVAAVFTEEGVMELGPLGHYEGREAIHTFIAGMSQRIPFTRHYQTGYLIEIDASGSAATGSWYGFETPTLEGRAVFGAFTYRDEYRKVGGRWLIARLTQTTHFLTPYESGWVKQPFVW